VYKEKIKGESKRGGTLGVEKKQAQNQPKEEDRLGGRTNKNSRKKKKRRDKKGGDEAPIQRKDFMLMADPGAKKSPKTRGGKKISG